MSTNYQRERSQIFNSHCQSSRLLGIIYLVNNELFMSVTLNVQSSQDILPFIMLLDARQIKAQSDSLYTSDGFKLTIHYRRLCACFRVMYTVQI